MSLAVGDRVPVRLGPPAHGGHVVARHDGQVLFVRHGLPGEDVLAQVTSLGPQGRFVRADAVEVLAAAPGRVAPTCPLARPGGCGGCDWQHAAPEVSRDLKRAVLAESLARFAGVALPEDVAVADLGGNPGGLGWRTRANLAVDQRGRAGLRPHRSRDLLALDRCPQLVDPQAAGAFTRSWAPGTTVHLVAPAVGAPMAFPAGSPPVAEITEHAAGRDWSVAAEGFWQVHPRAADSLVTAVGRVVDARAGERVVDLYAGVGLLGQGLAAALRAGGAAVRDLVQVESDRRAVRLARRNASATSDAAVTTSIAAPVERWVGRSEHLAGATLAILDPPRTGAGRAVIEALDRAPRLRQVAYVACDPVALARDAATLLARGWHLQRVEALDLFPSTHHLETVVGFARVARSG